MKTYIKRLGDRQIIKTLNEIVVNKGGKQIINPTEEMVLADGWVKYVSPEPKPIPKRALLEMARRKKLDELYAYDESKAVNDCIIVYQGQELHYWANKTDRDALKGALMDCMALGRKEYRLDLRGLGVSLSIPCEKLLLMLSVLEVYAIDCYNKTTDHEFAIKACTTEVEVDAYEFRGVGYPEIPRFEL